MPFKKVGLYYATKGFRKSKKYLDNVSQLVLLLRGR